MSTLTEVHRWEDVNPGQWAQVAQELGQRLPTAGVVAVHGAMGAGKTTMVRALLAAWNVREEGASPTFGLVHHHTVAGEQGTRDIRHMDLYRLQDEEEAERSGIAEMLLDHALNLVEWPERIPGLMPSDAWLIDISVNEDLTRTCILSRLRE
ncbi:MAG: tRNA (adenosine(37)-N6)-threonylcarbamoyltransferase complex ATPase subunit type 1 TsaE [Bacteroidota bacterium]|nr:tRNA (adenosine(37)-N6)-threonylcarbamoyltransferase complex ATPase subunit type 1 TsaE [Bacteroidota bacterium]